MFKRLDVSSAASMKKRFSGSSDFMSPARSRPLTVYHQTSLPPLGLTHLLEKPLFSLNAEDVQLYVLCVHLCLSRCSRLLSKEYWSPRFFSPTNGGISVSLRGTFTFAHRPSSAISPHLQKPDCSSGRKTEIESITKLIGGARSSRNSSKS